MKFTRLQIATLLATTPGVSASKSELLQFFRSPQYNPDEETESNHLDDFMVFRGVLDCDLVDCIDFSIDKTFLKNTPYKTTPLPKKVIKQMEDYQKEIDDYLKSLEEE